MPEILIVYDSVGGTLATMARQVARGVRQVPGVQARLRSVAPVSITPEAVAPAVPEDGAPYASIDDLVECSGLLLGSPTHFGNMTAAMKHFWDRSTEIWFGGGLAGKPAAVFTSTGGPHGGQESTLLSMMLPLLHHGMLIVGLPYTEPALVNTRSGGSPYGASHTAGNDDTNPLTEEEKELCQALGRRVASIAERLDRAAPQ